MAAFRNAVALTALSFGVGEGDARGIVDADMNILPADTTRIALSGPVARYVMPDPLEAAEALDVEMDHASRYAVLVADDGFGRIDVLHSR